MTAAMSPKRAAQYLGLPANRATAPLSVKDIAEVLSVKRERSVKPDTVASYLSKAEKERAEGRDRPGLFPPPDGREPLSRKPYWYPVTIAAYEMSRPGQGAGGGRPSHRVDATN